MVAEVALFAINEFPGLGKFIIPESNPKVFELLGLLKLNSSGVFVAGSMIETVLLKKLFPGRITVPALFVALIVVPLSLK